MKRAAGRPFLYDYDIDCKVLKAFDFNPPQAGFLSDLENKINDAVSKIEELIIPIKLKRRFIRSSRSS